MDLNSYYVVIKWLLGPSHVSSNKQMKRDRNWSPVLGIQNFVNGISHGKFLDFSWLHIVTDPEEILWDDSRPQWTHLDPVRIPTYC